MAIYHNHVSIISRGKNYSAVGKIAYNHAEKMTNSYDGKVYDYSRKRNVQGVEFVKGKDCPFDNAEQMCQHIENAEKADNAQLVRELEISIPVEYMESDGTITERGKDCVREYVNSILEEHGMICADISFHSPPEREGKNGRRVLKRDENGKVIFKNPHAHIITPMKEWDIAKEQWKVKCRKEYLWTDGVNEIYSADYPSDDRAVYEAWAKEQKSRCKEKNAPAPRFQKSLNEKGNVRSRRVEVSAWDNDEFVERIRAQWAETANKFLKEDGLNEISHLSNCERGIDNIPQIHLKKQDWHIMQCGGSNPNIDKYRAIEAYNITGNEFAKFIEEVQSDLKRERYKAIEITKETERISLKNQYEGARTNYFWLKPRYDRAVELEKEIESNARDEVEIDIHIKHSGKIIIPKGLREEKVSILTKGKELKQEQKTLFGEVSKYFKKKISSMKDIKQLFRKVKRRFDELQRAVYPEKMYFESRENKGKTVLTDLYIPQKPKFDDFSLDRVDVNSLDEIKRKLEYKENTSQKENNAWREQVKERTENGKERIPLAERIRDAEKSAKQRSSNMPSNVRNVKRSKSSIGRDDR